MANYIITVGTSILSNIARYKNLDFKAVNLEHVKEYLGNFPWDKLSAELNTLKRLKLDTNDNFFLLYSDDEEGEKSAKFLKYVLEKNGFFYVFPKKIDFLTKDFIQFSQKGLKNLLNVIVSIVEEYPDVSIVATGGYKAETAYATIAGIIFSIPVYYIHEDFKSLIELPPLPINIDIKLIQMHIQNIYEILKLPPNEVVKKINNLPKKLNYLFEKVDNQYVFSPMGSLIMRYYANQSLFESINDFEISVYKAHSTLFGDNIRKISDIKNELVRKLLKKVLRLSNKNIVRIIFDEFSPQKFDETYLVFKEQNENLLKYELKCKEGKQMIKFEVIPEAVSYVKEMLGEKLYL